MKQLFCLYANPLRIENGGHTDYSPQYRIKNPHLLKQMGICDNRPHYFYISCG